MLELPRLKLERNAVEYVDRLRAVIGAPLREVISARMRRVVRDLSHCVGGTRGSLARLHGARGRGLARSSPARRGRRRVLSAESGTRSGPSRYASSSGSSSTA